MLLTYKMFQNYILTNLFYGGIKLLIVFRTAMHEKTKSSKKIFMERVHSYVSLNEVDSSRWESFQPIY